MRKNKYNLLVVFLLFIVFIGLLSGCDSLKKSKISEEGVLLISVDIPTVLQKSEVSIQSILEEVVLEKMIFSVTKGGFVLTQTISVYNPNETVEVFFDDVATGNWVVEVLAVDNEEFNIAYGTKGINVKSDKINQADVELNLLPGNLTLEVIIPDCEFIDLGKVTLLGLVEGINDIVKEFNVIPGESKTINIGDLQAGIWPITGELYDSLGYPLFFGQEIIPILPGRTINAKIIFYEENPGVIKIDYNWNLPPERVENISLSYNNESVTISWDEVLGATGYLVLRSFTETGRVTIMNYDLIEETEFIDKYDFQVGQTYWYKVVAYNNNRLSSNYSEIVSITIPIIKNFETVLVRAGITSTENGSVFVDNDFYMSKYLITQAQYEELMGYNLSFFANNPNNPVERVTWYDAIMFCNKLSEKEDLNNYYNITEINHDSIDNKRIISATITENEGANGYRLPTEQEWEYAARGGAAGNATIYAGSNNLDDVGWYNNNTEKTKPVGLKLANELELYDMSGNLWEWTSQASGSYYVNRGGSWYSNASFCEVMGRLMDFPQNGHYGVGIRPVRTKVH